MNTNDLKNDNNYTVLCIDDEPNLLDDIAEELTEAGHNVVKAINGSIALEWLENNNPDLILCDISMPGISGYDVLKSERAKDPQNASVPFIFLTALADPLQIIQGKQMGADDYLVKPIDYALLIATVDTRLRQISRIKDAEKNNHQIDINSFVIKFNLTPAEIRVLESLLKGNSLKQIAFEFGLSRTTVAYHMRNLFQKTNTGRQAELIALLLQPNKETLYQSKF